jgi:predicted nucleic acid-binding protein
MLVVDASVAAKWVMPEPDSSAATALRHDSRPLIAPSLLLEEVGNIAWRRCRTGEIARDEAHMALPAMIALLARIVPAWDLHELALTIAIDRDHPIYDCFYVALALRENAQLVTADRRMAAMVQAVGIGVVSL